MAVNIHLANAVQVPEFKLKTQNGLSVQFTENKSVKTNSFSESSFQQKIFLRIGEVYSTVGPVCHKHALMFQVIALALIKLEYNTTV